MKKIARRQQQQQQQQEQEQIGGSRRGPSRGGRLSNDDSEGETSCYRVLRLITPLLWENNQQHKGGVMHPDMKLILFQ